MHRIAYEVSDKEIFRVIFNVILFFGTFFFSYILALKKNQRALLNLY